MIRWLITRVLASVALFFLVLAFAFALIHLVPGGPADLYLSSRITPQERQIMATTLGLNHPLPVQFLQWLDALGHGNLGYSYLTAEPVRTMVAQALPATLWLLVPALTITAGVVAIAAVYAAGHPDSLLERVIRWGTRIGMAWPDFWVGTILLAGFAVLLPIFPVGGIGRIDRDGLAGAAAHWVLPVTVLVLANAAPWIRFLKAQLDSVLVQPYIRTALAKGLSPMKVIWRHALPNALMPLIALFGFEILPQFFAGAVITETIFNWPGMGRLFWTSALNRDYPVMMAGVVLVAGMTIGGNLVADLTALLIDPRGLRP